MHALEALRVRRRHEARRPLHEPRGRHLPRLRAGDERRWDVGSARLVACAFPLRLAPRVPPLGLLKLVVRLATRPAIGDERVGRLVDVAHEGAAIGEARDGVVAVRRCGRLRGQPMVPQRLGQQLLVQDRLLRVDGAGYVVARLHHRPLLCGEHERFKLGEHRLLEKEPADIVAVVAGEGRALPLKRARLLHRGVGQKEQLGRGALRRHEEEHALQRRHAAHHVGESRLVGFAPFVKGAHEGAHALVRRWPQFIGGGPKVFLNKLEVFF